MVEANVKIIEELKMFLEIVTNDHSIRKLVTQSENDFTRDRKLTMERIVGLLINLPKRSLSIELQEFFYSLKKGIAASSHSNSWRARVYRNRSNNPKSANGETKIE